ncbi:uncharacterized protein LOC142290230 isoform X1 [Anomaloglossus baeobatrachus]|uniref:uncharacterized protein LOC142290230 isoform X1 n=1 Tax=Anomaloglossus baeobatrachus TaxID=238106 RepID=UPI003F4FF42A
MDSSDYVPSAYFYIGTNDSDDENGFDCESASYISMLNQIWDDIGTWEEGYNPPLGLAIKKLRILKGLRISSRESKQTLTSYNALLNKRISKISAAFLEYKEHLCTQVFSVLEEENDLTDIKEEIQQIKTEIEQAKLFSYQKNQKIRKRSLLGYIKEAFIRSNQLNTIKDENQEFEAKDLDIVTSRENQPDQKSSNKEEENGEASTSGCLKFRKLSWRK